MNNNSVESVVILKKALNQTCYKFFSCLSNPTRLATIEMLIEKPMSVNEIATALGEEQSMISHNLKLLLDCNFIESNRDGKKRVYSLNRETIESLFKIVTNHAKKYCPKGGRCGIKGDQRK
ncbi:MAG: metalloregulator ArsR/SmtB family transcription factor [Candidatus Bathyarchaeota archaeon]|nr:metalloregulator ArsR/SmtB family transcription factor [Candidatus Bathyarchaeota archaeon]